MRTGSHISARSHSCYVCVCYVYDVVLVVPSNTRGMCFFSLLFSLSYRKNTKESASVKFNELKLIIIFGRRYGFAHNTHITYTVHTRINIAHPLDFIDLKRIAIDWSLVCYPHNITSCGFIAIELLLDISIVQSVRGEKRVLYGSVWCFVSEFVHTQC